MPRRQVLARASSYAADETGEPLTRWDGCTTKAPGDRRTCARRSGTHPARTLRKPAPGQWPQADFIVGNPPFIGNKRMRDALGDGYVEALRGAWQEMPDTADFVMYWWEHAAKLVRANIGFAPFGFITTNSLRQTFNRRSLIATSNAKPALGLRYAIPDHPWVDSANGAAVRIAMTVGRAGACRRPIGGRFRRDELPMAKLK